MHYDNIIPTAPNQCVLLFVDLFKYRKEDEKHFINEDTDKFTLVLIRQMPR